VDLQPGMVLMYVTLFGTVLEELGMLHYVLISKIKLNDLEKEAVSHFRNSLFYLPALRKFSNK
jgi:hypothetical protein